jgi:hypothetical protein
LNQNHHLEGKSDHLDDQIVLLHSEKRKSVHIRSYVCLMVFNVIFNNISVISWRSVLLVEETGGSGENH